MPRSVQGTARPPRSLAQRAACPLPLPLAAPQVDPIKAKALETILILHMDHEQVGGGTVWMREIQVVGWLVL